MNLKLGLWSSAALTIAVVLFAVMMLARMDYGAYAMSMLISWAYVVLACSFSATARPGGAAAAQTGVAFGVMYSGFVTTVYFVQLTTVLHQNAAPDILKLLTYQELGSLMFNIDLLGYGLMSVSTIFIGLTLVGRGTRERWLKFLLIAHGVFGPMCLALPVLNVFATMPKSGGDAVGIAVLLFWCAYFIPVGILAVFHFAITLRPLAFVSQHEAAASHP